MNKIVLLWIVIVFVIVGLAIAGQTFFKEEEVQNPETALLEEESQSPAASPEESSAPEIKAEGETKPVPLFGIYEICSDVEGCDVEKGILKIKEAGAKAVIVTAVEDAPTEAYYLSQYLPMADYVEPDYFEKAVNLAHQNGIKVYASINLPHSFWLDKHPDWLAVWSNGKPADFYEDDYFHRIVPPSRVVAEQECLDLLRNIIGEVVSYGVDGIDINDNFQFSDQYLEEEETTLYSSFDDFALSQFEKETGGSQNEWYDWRAEKVTGLIKILKEYAGDIPLRPHLLTYDRPYEDYGLDYGTISQELGNLYLMIGPDEPKERYFELIQGVEADKIIASTYLYQDFDDFLIEKDEQVIFDRVNWLAQAGADEIYLYNFALIEEARLWPIIKDVLDKIMLKD
jgi:hypothetical protein